MHSSTQMLSLILLLFLVGLLIPASIALYRVRSLALPISTATATATLILPMITGVTLRAAHSLTRRSHGGQGDGMLNSSWSAMILIMLLVIYETVIATLALTHMVPPNDLRCHLDLRWSWLFSNKNVDVIRRIQDRHQCCGLNSVEDRAWPFPDRSHTAAACYEAFGRQRSCFGGWRQDEQITGGLMLLVAVVAFLLKLLMLVIHRNRNPFDPSIRNTLSPSATEGDGRAGSTLPRIENAYHDDLLPETDGHLIDSQSHDESDDQGRYTGSVMQPSRLRESNGRGDD